MELEVAEGLIDEVPPSRWEALIEGSEKPTIDEASALLVIWAARKVGRAEPSEQLRTSVIEISGGSDDTRTVYRLNAH
jgi:hypothetical protein